MENNGYSKRPFWQTILIYLIIGGLIYFAIYYFFLAKKGNSSPIKYQAQSVVKEEAPVSSPASPAANESENTVTLTADGFSLLNLSIKAGQTVTWVNNSGKKATVDSGPHPVHTTYSPLNLGSFAQGEKLTLTFSKPGVYNYHNHFNSSQKGIIIVQ